MRESWELFRFPYVRPVEPHGDTLGAVLVSPPVVRFEGMRLNVKKLNASHSILIRMEFGTGVSYEVKGSRLVKRMSGGIGVLEFLKAVSPGYHDGILIRSPPYFSWAEIKRLFRYGGESPWWRRLGIQES